jgi:hypothetical protein
MGPGSSFGTTSASLCCSLPIRKSSSDSKPALPTLVRIFSSRSTVMPSSAATSSSVAGRPSCVSRRTYACFSCFCWSRTNRGTQSSLRSISKMAPRTSVIAYVSNLMPLVGSNWSTALIRPTTPALMRSSRSRPPGSGPKRRPAVIDTRCAYRCIRESRACWLLRVLYSRHSCGVETSPIVSTSLDERWQPVGP